MMSTLFPRVQNRLFIVSIRAEDDPAMLRSATMAITPVRGSKAISGISRRIFALEI
jgi:hypothetical protein